jgi:hypothetical protein
MVYAKIKCSRQDPVIADYYDYRHYQSISPYDYLQMDCPTCKAKGSMNVYYTLENARL